jgi:hypothetical protein
MTDHRRMSREAIAARDEHVRRLLVADPDLSTEVLCARTGASDKAVWRVRREVKAGTTTAKRLDGLEAEVAALSKRIALIEGEPEHELRPPVFVAARRIGGWTMAKASEKVGVAESTWCRWERGEYRCRGDTALRIIEKLRALGVALPAVQR